MNKLLSIVLGVFLMISFSGCLSSAVYKQSVNQVGLRKAIIANNQPAIRAFQLGNGGVGLGIDIGNWEALTEQPLKQIGAALGDAALIWGTYEGGKYVADKINGSGDNSSSSPGNSVNNGGTATSVNVNGDNNTVNTGNTKTTTN